MISKPILSAEPVWHQSAFPRILRDPLVLFLVGGCLIYALLAKFERSSQAVATNGEIRIDRKTVLDHIQFRAKTFDRAFAEQALASMSPERVAQILDEIRTEEALYREARALGLDRGDYIIRQRLVGKLSYMIEGDAQRSVATEDDLRAYFAVNAEDYALPATLTFRHLFFGNGPNADDRARLARAVDGQGVSGERFLYADNYADRTWRYLSPIFGETMTDALFSSEMPTGEWAGPLRSPHGVHLVWINDRRTAHTPVFDAVRDSVVVDHRRAAYAALNSALSDRIKSRYPVRIDSDVAVLVTPRR